MKVTLVATVRNEEGSIGQFVDAIRAQTRPPDEIVVVDGGSADGTVRLLREGAAHDPRWRIIEAPGTNIAAGRNIAIAAASHGVIAVTDAGTSADAEWLERLLEPLSRAEVDVCAGFFRAGGETWFESCLGTVILPHESELDPENFLPSSRSVAFRRTALERVGGYPEWLSHCEDLVLDLRLRDAGARFAVASDAIVRWRARPSLAAFARQYYAYARGDGHAALWPKRHAARYAAYASGIALLVLSRRRRWALPLLLAGLAVHFRRYHLRVHRGGGSWAHRAARHAAVPLIVLVGDLAKMVGYPVGRVQRRRVAPVSETP